MMFVSYAQNFEDVMLWRALKHLETGFYLDIGAQDPIVDSVSRGFYEKGWRGVHLEPTSEYAAKLRENRPDEVVLQNAVGDGSGSIRFFEFSETGLSTGNATIAAEHTARGLQYRETKVDLISLDMLFERFENKQIHWMKIDVEGMEDAVLASWSENSTRPWIVVIESTEPLSPERAETAWKHHLADRGYEICYFDGLNSYFVSNEHQELKGAFSTPPNVFDDFALSGTATSRISALMRSRLADLMHELGESRKHAEDFHNYILSLHSSFSWRITAPYRVLSRAMKRGPQLATIPLPRLGPFVKRRLRYAFRLIVKFPQGNPRLYNLARKLVNSHPSLRLLYTRILRISRGQPGAQNQKMLTGGIQTHKIVVSNKDLATLSSVGRIKARQISIR
jgi:FkbM family methyltransferase